MYIRRGPVIVLCPSFYLGTVSKLFPHPAAWRPSGRNVGAHLGAALIPQERHRYVPFVDELVYNCYGACIAKG